MPIPLSSYSALPFPVPLVFTAKFSKQRSGKYQQADVEHKVKGMICNIQCSIVLCVFKGVVQFTTADLSFMFSL